MENLNTMESFGNGFKIKRNGVIHTLTSDEMCEFRYLDNALTGKSCLECYENHCDIEDREERKIIEEMKKDKHTCNKIEEDVLDILFENAGEVERDVIHDYILRKMRNDKKV